ncbi:MAG TPA: sensor histidine kinase [Casimicrobiaceae bacterium]|nr:sensor histidine kinase [Casimicrobiaceae bacterium]
MKIMNFGADLAPRAGNAGTGVGERRRFGPVSLRLQINSALTVLMLLFIGALVALEIDDSRRSVAEEIEASSRIAGQLLTEIARLDQSSDAASVRAFLLKLGRVRANEIELTGHDGEVLYRSPPPTYKAGRDAPPWFARLMTPQIGSSTILLRDGRLSVTPNASRSVLDAWDDLKRFALICGAFLVVVNVAVFWFTGRAVAPLERITGALSHIERGALDTRLPLLRGREARQIGESFNRMASAVEETMRIREQAERARAQLADGRALARVIQQRMEEERRFLARELHDELGQTVTAIRSIAASIDAAGRDDETTRRIRMIEELAVGLQEGMRELIPRLRPLALDELGLAEALRDLVEDHRLHHPAIAFELAIDGSLDGVPGELAIALYRVAQESLTNVVKHARATRCAVSVAAQTEELSLRVEDDGSGVAETDLAKPGRFGVRGMRERIESLGGSLSFARAGLGGLAVVARLPLAAAAQD